jgi:hypothetical protein
MTSQSPLPGTTVDNSTYGTGVQVVPAGRTARLIKEEGVLVSAGDTPVDHDILFSLIDAGRRSPSRLTQASPFRSSSVPISIMFKSVNDRSSNTGQVR